MPLSRPENYFGCAVLLLVGIASGCAPEIGDECSNALDCSASGTRLCDQTQPRGYCTLEGCEENTCPGEAVCVQFGRQIDGQAVDRLSRTYCMYKCDSNSDCRTDDRYACFGSEDFGSRAEANVLGNAKQKFCAPRPPVPAPMSSEPDAGETPDAGMMSEPDAAMGLPDAAMSLPDAGMNPPDDDAGASE